MRNFIPFLLIALTLTVHGQAVQEKVLFVVDSIAIMEEPNEEDGELAETDIETLTVVTNKADIEKHGYRDLDKIIFIITKEYARRPAELKKISSTKQMVKKNGRWQLNGTTTPYSGPFVDYFYNGKKQGDGTLKDGLLEGLRTAYFGDGTISFHLYFLAGIKNGESKEYFRNGKIFQEGVFKNGKEHGLWKEWYSTGNLKRQIEFDEGKAIVTKELEKFQSLYSKGLKLFDEGNYSGAIKNYDKAIELNPAYSDVYLHKGRAYLYDLKFEEALANHDKAIELEPLYMEAYSNRAFVRIRKHEMKNTRTLSKNNEVTILAGGNDEEIPKDELEKICADLNKAAELGNTQTMITEAIKEYCQQ